jgi:peptidyl-prolyl cis-trans isomerase C
MTRRPALVALALSSGIVFSTATPLFAGMSPAEQARRLAPVAHVGSVVITAGELEDRLAAVPRFQLKAFGETPDAIRRGFLDQIILPEVLYSLAAEKLHLADQLPASNKVLRSEASAATRAIIGGARPAASIDQADIDAYYNRNRGKFDTPERLYLFRILCSTREAAEKVLVLAHKDPTLEGFTKLAHDSSIDKATALRGGNLGYLTPDGVSSEAGFSVDPAIVKAAGRVRDGEFVPEPVVEKNGATHAYAVIWRRGTVPANHRSVHEAATQIREAIWKEETDTLAKKGLEDLRRQNLTELNEALLNGIEITSNEGDVVTRRRPGEVPPLTQTGRNAPHATN